jgi:hypothetical protein
MGNIPIDLERRCEQRWAARFSQPVESIASRNRVAGKGGPADRRARHGEKPRPRELRAGSLGACVVGNDATSVCANWT